MCELVNYKAKILDLLHILLFSKADNSNVILCLANFLLVYFLSYQQNCYYFLFLPLSNCPTIICSNSSCILRRSREKVIASYFYYRYLSLRNAVSSKNSHFSFDHLQNDYTKCIILILIIKQICYNILCFT